MIETKTKQTVESKLQEEIEAMRFKLQEGKRTKEEFTSVIGGVVLGQPLSKDQIESLADAMYPLFKPVELDGKTLVLEIPIEGTIPDEMLMKYCAYIDLLKGMGAKGAIFVPKGCKAAELSDRDLERFGLRRI